MLTNTINKIKLNSSTIYEIVPTTIADERNKLASCPALTKNSSVELQVNKTTVISQNSTDMQYPTAKAVYDYIQTYISSLS